MTICAWCGVKINDTPMVGGEISHGICESCAAKELAEFAAGKEGYVELDTDRQNG